MQAVCINYFYHKLMLNIIQKGLYKAYKVFIDLWFLGLRICEFRIFLSWCKFMKLKGLFIILKHQQCYC